MNTSFPLMPLLGFVAVLIAIPCVLWLLKRSGYGGAAGSPGLMRTVSQLALSPSQKVVVVEMGRGAQARWLVLGVTPQQITTLTESPVLDNVQPDLAMPQATTVAQLMERFAAGSAQRSRRRSDGDPHVR